jgi:hypothetical protein
MQDVLKLINLPWAALLILASGYAAYYVANVGIRDYHKTIQGGYAQRGLRANFKGGMGPALIAPTPDDAALMILRRYCA